MKKLNLLGNGFTRREDLDFTDDGTRFTAYEYNGMIITKTTYQGEYFISIRIDYLTDVNFVYDDYKDKEWYKLCDKFNGVYEINIDELRATITLIKAHIECLKEEVENDPIDEVLMEKRLLEEQKMLTNFIYDHKVINVLKYTNYEITRVADYLTRLNDIVRIITNELETKNYNRYQYKYLQRTGSIHIKSIEDNYYTKQILEILNK